MVTVVTKYKSSMPTDVVLETCMYEEAAVRYQWCGSRY
jgi:hypothetical protein